MATKADIDALLAITCGWCGASAGEFCHASTTRSDQASKGTHRHQPTPITTLDGGCHDTRWRAALSRPANIITAAVPHPDPENPAEANVAPSSDSSGPVLVGAGW